MNSNKNNTINVTSFAKLLTEKAFQGIIKKPRSRGISGALYLKSAIAGVMSGRGLSPVELPDISGVDVWVFRNRNP